MKEEKRPAWFKGVTIGGKSDSPPKAEPELTAEPVLKSTPTPVPETTLGDTVRPKELAFSLQKGGWRQEGGAGAEGSSEISKESDLVRLYLDLSDSPPANFEKSVRPDRKREAAEQMPSWTVESLHKYLSRPDVWSRPSFTKAVFEEIRARMLAGKMSPRA